MEQFTLINTDDGNNSVNLCQCICSPDTAKNKKLFKKNISYIRQLQ